VYLLAREGLDASAAQGRARIPRKEIVNAQEVGGLLPNQVTAFSQQVTHRPFFFRIDRARGENAQPQKMGSPPRIMAIIGILQPFVLCDGGGVG
jgi:hypothetical protein